MARLPLLVLSMLLFGMEPALSHTVLSPEQVAEELEKLNKKIDDHAGTEQLADAIEKLGSVLGENLALGIKELAAKLTESIQKLGKELKEGVEEQEKKEKELERTLAADSISRCQDFGRNTSVAFTAKFKGDNIALGTHSTLKFDNVITNIGKGYDPRTGIFTAPTAGVYVFYLTQMAVNGQGAIFLALDKEGAPLDLIFAYGDTAYDQGSTQVTTQLAAGERVWVRQERGTIVRGDQWTVFTGYLIHTD